MNTRTNSKDTCRVNILDTHKTIRILTIAVIAIISIALTNAYGQNEINMQNGRTIITDCSQTYIFYDSGSEYGDYNNSEDYTYIFESCNSITITFSSFVTESGYDKLTLSNNGDNLSEYSGTQPTFSYEARSGILIITWHSDSGLTKNGWAATVTCSGDPCSSHTLSYNTTANCSGTGTASEAPTGTTALSATVTSEVPTCSSVPLFVGWNTAQDGSGTSYVAGDKISLLRENATLYAQYSDCGENTITEGSSTNYNVPFCSYAGYGSAPRSSYSQLLYTKAQITEASGYDGRCLIKKIYFNYYGTDNQEMTFDLYMANTTKTSLTSYVNTNISRVVSNKTITFTPGWIEIALDNDFLWDGTSNLMIAMHAKTDISTNSNRKFYHSQVSNSVKYQYSTNNLYDLQSNYTPSGTWSGGTTTNTLPNLKLCIAPYCEPPTFEFSTSTATCALGGSYNLTTLFTLRNPTGRTVTYSCDPAQATISGTTITPLVGGDITITAHIDADNGNCAADATATLTVTCDDSRFEFNQYGVFCTIGNTVSAPSYTKTSTSTSITYSSDNEAIATANPSTGAVTGISEGYTTITATLAASGSYCQKTATFVAYVSPDESCMPFTVGNCNVHLSDHCESPFYTNNYYTYSYVQMLYLASELRASGLSAGKINKIAFHYYGRPTGDPNFSQKFRLFIAPTSATSLYDSWATPEFEKKFDGEKSFTPDSWTYIELTDGFDWDGTSNILIAVNTYGTVLPASCQFCTRNSEELARYLGKQSIEIDGATEIPLNPTTKLPSYSGDHSEYRADIKFCQDASIIVLPIELTDFKVNCKGNKIEVSWETASERNNETFILERSSNAMDFTEIARISGAGNSIETLRYTYNDDNPNQGDNYYRLQQVDTDGTRSVSEIIVAQCGTSDNEKQKVDAYPNPFSDELTVTLSNFNSQHNIIIEVFDMLGKEIASKTIENPDSYQEIKFNLDGIPQAAYNVRVSSSVATINKLVVKGK